MSDGPRVPLRQPPGWYVDPGGRGLLRWWDGNRWAEATRPLPGPPAAGQAAAGQPGQFPPDRRLPDALRPPGRTPLGSPARRVTRADRLYSDPDYPDARDDDWTRISADTVTRARARGGEAPAPAPSQSADVAAEELDSNARLRLWLSAVFAFSLLLFGVGLALDSSVLRILSLLAALFSGVGAAPLQLSPRTRADLRLCVAAIVGVSTPLVAGTAMLLTGAWFPTEAAMVLAVAAIGMHIAGCRSVLAGPRGSEILHSMVPHIRIRDVFDASVSCTLAGTLLWAVGIAAMGHIVPGQLGFLPKAPPYWFLGLMLVVIGIILAGDRGPRAAAGVVSLLGALTLTPAVVYAMPKQQSSAKHLDLVLAILQSHNISGSAGLYRDYSGLFAVVAWLAHLSGTSDVTSLATYFTFVMDLVAIVGLRYFFGNLTRSRYRIWLAITLVILANSVGEDYFSPQATAFAMGLGVLGLTLCTPSQGLSDRGRLAILLLAGCGLAVTHELSPYIIGGVLIVFVVFRVVRPWYLPATILLPAIAWAVLHRGDLSGFISLSSLGDLSNFSPPAQAAGPSTPGLSRLAIVPESADALALGLVILIGIACLGLVRNIRNRAAWALMVSPAVGLIMIAANPYGQEGIFRAALFAIPALAAVGTQALPAVRSRWASTACGVLVACLAGIYLVSSTGLDNANVMRQSDYDAMLTFLAKAEPDAYILGLTYGNNVPDNVGIPPKNGHWLDWGGLITQREADIMKPTPQDAAVVARQYYEYAKKYDGETGHLYALWTWSDAEYAVDYGHETMGQAQAWRSALLASPDWKVVYGGGGSYLFEATAKVSTPAASVSKPKKPKKPAASTAPKKTKSK